MKLHLIDSSPLVVEAWRRHFSNFPEVEIACGNLLDHARNSMVSPANSHGFMDGGIDAHFLAFFGTSIQDRVQRAIAQRPEGFLPVGASLVVPTGHPQVAWLIVAPTMEMPGAVPAHHAERAMRAILRISKHEAFAGDVYCPGLATGTGRVDPDDAARGMAEAYAEWKQRQSDPES